MRSRRWFWTFLLKLIFRYVTVDFVACLNERKYRARKNWYTGKHEKFIQRNNNNTKIERRLKTKRTQRLFWEGNKHARTHTTNHNQIIYSLCLEICLVYLTHFFFHSLSSQAPCTRCTKNTRLRLCVWVRARAHAYYNAEQQTNRCTIQRLWAWWIRWDEAAAERERKEKINNKIDR